MKDRVIEYFEDLDGESLLNIVIAINSYDGSFEDFNYWENDEEFFNTFFRDDIMGAMRAAHYGNYEFTDEAVRFNAYGNLESTSWYQIKEEVKGYVEDIADWLINNYQHIKNNLDFELIEILEEEE